MWYDEQPEYTCNDCDEKQSKLEDAQDFLKGIVDLLYGDKQFDLNHFEFCLDNLCSQLNVKLPDGDLVLHRPTPTDRAIEAWKKWSVNYLKSLTYTQD